MSRKKGIVGVLIAVLLLSGICIAGDAKEERAVKAADAWLKLVDHGKYRESWKTAAQYFQDAVTRAQWEQAVIPVRKPLGKVLKRTMKSKEYRTTLPGAPDGEYVVIQYTTSFENKHTAIETVTPMLDKDGSWRVSGYYIK
ncbi:MAG: DUF4019 domain-containing protein [Nitrospirota bacterium]